MKPSVHRARVLKRYTAQRLPLLTFEEERALVLRAKRGDRSAADRLVRANLGLVLQFVARKNLGSLGIEDAIQEGQLGILSAIERFDLSSRVRLATYAMWWVRAFVERAIRACRSLVRPRAGISTLVPADLSLEAPLSNEGDATHLDVLEADGPSPEDQHLDADHDARVRAVLRRVLENKRPLFRDVALSRLCEGEDGATCAELAERHGVSRQRVHQVEVQVRAVLERVLAREGFGDRKAVA